MYSLFLRKHLLLTSLLVGNQGVAAFQTKTTELPCKKVEVRPTDDNEANAVCGHRRSLQKAFILLFFAMITSFYLSESRLSYKLNWRIFFRTCMLKLNTSMAWQFWTRDIKVHFQVVEVLKTCIQFATLYFSIHCVRSVIYTLFWEDTKMIFFFKHIHHSLIKIESWSYFIFIFLHLLLS